MAASLAGLLFGFDTAVISGVTGALRSEFALSAVGLGTAVSAALIGTLVGALGAGAPGDRFGSRTVLVWIALGYIVSAIGSGMLSHKIEGQMRSEEHTSELQSLMRISYAVLCLKKQNKKTTNIYTY